MKHVTSSRRQVVMATLLGLAVVGGAMRHWAGNPSLARDIGTLLLVLWLPAVGNLVAFAVRQWHARTRRRTGFDDGAFSPQLLLRLTALGVQDSRGALPPPDPRRCTIAIGNEGFTARTELPLALALGAGGTPQDVPLELLRPALALARLRPGAQVELLAGDTAVARGSVLRPLP